MRILIGSFSLFTLLSGFVLPVHADFINSTSSGPCTSNGLKGNGNVTTKNRPINPATISIQAETGLQVHVSINPNTTAELRVEAESNLLDRIYSNAQENTKTLRLYASNICATKPIHVYLTLPSLTKVESSSGANVDIQGNSQIHTVTASAGSQIIIKGGNPLQSVSASAGSTIEASSIQTKKLKVQANAGGQITLQGQATTIESEASSGGTINAKKLKSLSATMDASSGAQIEICSSKTATITESSGGSASNSCS